MTRLALALLIASPLASAQTAAMDPWPLVPGNSWVYTSGPISNPVYPQTWTVLDSVETAAGRLPRIRFESEFVNGECLVSRERTDLPWGGVRFVFRGLSVSGNARCATWPIPIAGFYPVGTADSSRFSLVGPQASSSPLIVGYGSIPEYESWQGYEDAGTNPSKAVNWQAAGGIGLTSFSSRTCGGGVPCSWGESSLRYAAVGGRTFGTPVAGEDVPAATEVLDLTVGPNPVRASAQVAFSLPTASEARIEVLDALGRTIQRLDLGTRSAGVQSARLDVSGLAAGVYSVRLVAGSVRTATRISVVR